MSTNELKWRANMDKVAYARAFPGMLGDFSDAIGLALREIVQIEEMPELAALIFDDHRFLIVAARKQPAPADLLRAIAALRSVLEPHHADAYKTLDELTQTDRDLTRRARLENILGAIRTNIEHLPELYERIPELLEELRSGGGACERRE